MTCNDSIEGCSGRKPGVLLCQVQAGKPGGVRQLAQSLSDGAAPPELLRPALDAVAARIGNGWGFRDPSKASCRTQTATALAPPARLDVTL